MMACRFRRMMGGLAICGKRPWGPKTIAKGKISTIRTATSNGSAFPQVPLPGCLNDESVTTCACEEGVERAGIR